jgi:leucine-rich repeat protein SHOC2
MKKLPENWVQNLTSLEHLVFYELRNQTFQEIGTCFKGDINYLPSLRIIDIAFCSYLKTLPNWICNISSVQHITIRSCKSIASVPEGMHLLTKLHTLEIIDCPLLHEECMTQTSETWHKIAHIPNIILKR